MQKCHNVSRVLHFAPETLRPVSALDLPCMKSPSVFTSIAKYHCGSISSLTTSRQSSSPRKLLLACFRHQTCYLVSQSAFATRLTNQQYRCLSLATLQQFYTPLLNALWMLVSLQQTAKLHLRQISSQFSCYADTMLQTCPGACPNNACRAPAACDCPWARAEPDHHHNQSDDSCRLQ